MVESGGRIVVGQCGVCCAKTARVVRERAFGPAELSARVRPPERPGPLARLGAARQGAAQRVLPAEREGPPAQQGAVQRVLLSGQLGPSERQGAVQRVPPSRQLGPSPPMWGVLRERHSHQLPMMD